MRLLRNVLHKTRLRESTAGRNSENTASLFKAFNVLCRISVELTSEKCTQSLQCYVVDFSKFSSKSQLSLVQQFDWKLSETSEKCTLTVSAQNATPSKSKSRDSNSLDFESLNQVIDETFDETTQIPQQSLNQETQIQERL